ncbi:LIC12162 family protein [Candidatus Omnitrophota bacterium]
MGKKYLATTAVNEIWDKDKDIILLGPWCLSGAGRARLSEKDVVLAGDIKYSTENLLNNASYCEGVYSDLLVELSDALNSLHGVNKSLDYWSTLLSAWLISHVYMMHEKYTRILNVAAREQGDLYSHIVDPDKNMAPNDTHDFIANKIEQEYYNLQLFSQIIPEFNLNAEKINLESPKDLKAPALKERVLNRTKLLLKKTLDKCQSVFLRDGDIAMADMYHVSFWDYAYLNFKTRSRLSLDAVFPPWQRERFEYDRNPRAELDLKKNSDDIFINILKKSIKYTIPRCYVEGYSHIVKYVDSISRKDPKIIFSAVGWHFNERFKFYAAKMKEKGSRLSGVQHGGDYGFGQYLSLFAVELKNKDMFFSWGWKHGDDSSKIKFLPSPHLSKFKNKSTKSSDCIVYISANYPRHFFTLSSYPGSEGMETYFRKQFLFFEKLPHNISKKTYYRAYPTDFSRDIKNKIKSIEPSIKWADDGKSSDWMKKVKLVVMDYPGTAIVEALVMNTPTIIFYDSDLWAVNDDAREYFEMLKNAGIVHPDPVSAIKKIEETYDNILQWWEREDVQNARSEFVKKYGYATKDWRKIWARELCSLREEL